ncbi:MAG: hypothetical protein LH606_03315 [Cytophagaceae bacterium]|nr:hypothetical protein [Cytophagaceae bacterium]
MKDSTLTTRSRFSFTHLLLLTPILIFGFYWSKYAVDVPWFDDFEVIPGFLLQWINAKTWSEKLHWLFWPNNEHRMAYGKLLAVLQYSLTGTLNFRWLEGLANLSVVGVAGLFWLAFRRLNQPAWCFLPVVLLLFQPQYHLLSFWTITGLQHQPVVFFGCLSMYWLARGSTRALVWALLLGGVATFTMSNGMFVWAAGAGVLLVQRRWAHLLAWLLGSVGAMGAYFYQFPANTANARSFTRFLEHPELSLVGLFTFWGASFDVNLGRTLFQRAALPTLAGVILLVGMLIWAWRQAVPWLIDRTLPRPIPAREQTTGFLLGVFFFLLVNALVIAVLRPHFGYDVLLLSNYRLYPILALVLAYLMVLTQQKVGLSRPLVLGLIGAALVFNLVSYWAFTPQVAQRRADLLARVFNQNYAGIGLGATRGDIGLETGIENTFRELIRRGIYQPPLLFNPDAPPGTTTATDTNRIRRVESDALRVVFEARPENAQSNQYVFLKGQRDRYLYLFRGSGAPRRNPFGKPAPTYATIPLPELRPSPYRVGILTTTGQKVRLVWTGEQLQTMNNEE